MAAPHPEPTQLKILKGNPGQRRLPENEPMPDVPARVPAPPAYLKGLARDEWRSIAGKLHKLGLLTEVDTKALAQYCQAYKRWREAEEMVDKLGLITITAAGSIAKSPFVTVANEAMRDCFAYLTSFGMTPSSRAKVTSAKTAPKSKFTGLISGGKK